MSGLRWVLAYALGIARAAVERLGAWRGLARMHVAVGQGLVEYALILVLIAIVVIGVLSTLGSQTSKVFDQVNCTLSNGSYHHDNGNGNSNRCQ